MLANQKQDILNRQSQVFNGLLKRVEESSKLPISKKVATDYLIEKRFQNKISSRTFYRWRKPEVMANSRDLKHIDLCYGLEPGTFENFIRDIKSPISFTAFIGELPEDSALGETNKPSIEGLSVEEFTLNSDQYSPEEQLEIGYRILGRALARIKLAKDTGDENYPDNPWDELEESKFNISTSPKTTSGERNSII